MRKRIYINDDWSFSGAYTDEMTAPDYDAGGFEKVRIPHTVKEIPYHYFDESMYQLLSCYRKTFKVQKGWMGKKVLLTFDAVAHDAEVFINGEKAGEHHSGYTAFTVDISELIKYGSENVIAVRVDSRESLNTPPFGYVVDYLTYGGIYRSVHIDVMDNTYIEDVFISTKIANPYIGSGDEDSKAVMLAGKAGTVSGIKVSGDAEDVFIRQSIRKKGEEEYRELGITAFEPERPVEQRFTDVQLWSPENPALYEIKTELLRKAPEGDGEVTYKEIDERVDRIGFRKAVFNANGFWLNGSKYKIRGLNRHQSYPYVGYAMPDSMQEYDAYILKNELGLNAVRTSHYPQSQSFIDKCDELGLIVFTEFPGWQHIGDDAWKDQALVNLEEMIVQYRNHPSIVLWGVRINESVDDEEFYERTNALAHKIDPTRQTGGVRCYKKGIFQEDVFTYNDFSHTGDNKGVEKKSQVTSDTSKGYLVSEYNGHMYPSKMFDWEEHRLQHALRHANVLDEVAAQSDISGSFGWCMFDYNTHKDFGSGDRICYHGVMDMFRNPKLAAAVYASQKNIEDGADPVLCVSSSMDIGEHPGSNRGDVYIFTNADSVKMYKNGEFIKEFQPADSPYKNLLHGPILVDDYIGDQLETKEGMKPAQAESVKQLLNAVARTGLYDMNKLLYLKAGRLMVQYKMTMEQATDLFGRYIGNWGGASTEYKFEAIYNGEVVKTEIKSTSSERRLQLIPSHTELKEDISYDAAEIRIRLTDEFGNVLPFANDPLKLSVSGAIELIGPDMVSLQGGCFGTYVRTTGKKGKGTLTVSTATGETETVTFNVSK